MYRYYNSYLESFGWNGEDIYELEDNVWTRHEAKFNKDNAYLDDALFLDDYNKSRFSEED